jgi:hypothetical protein
MLALNRLPGEGMPAKLVGLRGSLIGQAVALGVETTLGREAGNTLVLADNAVGRRHARILETTGVYVIEDLGSTNGTFVNDERISGAITLKWGDVVRLGDQLLRFEVGVPDAHPKVEVGRGEAAPFAAGRPVENPGLFRTSSMGWNPGCLELNLEGCLRWLIIMLLAIALIVVIILVIGGLAGGAGALGGLGSGAGGPFGGQGGGGGAGGGSQGASGQGGSEQQGRTQEGGPVRIIEVKVDFGRRPSYSTLVPLILVTWQNVGKQPIRQVQGRVTGYDESGREIGKIPNVWVYRGEPVPPGAQHTDTLQEGGIVAVPREGNTLSRAPKTAKVDVIDAR